MYTGAFGSLSGGRSWCTAGAITSTSPYVSYPSNIQPSQEAISALQLALLIEEVQDSPTVSAVICSCRYTTLSNREAGINPERRRKVGARWSAEIRLIRALDVRRTLSWASSRLPRHNNPAILFGLGIPAAHSTVVLDDPNLETLFQKSLLVP